ncbi:hypothetical protein [Streptomyces sp. NPDC002067]
MSNAPVDPAEVPVFTGDLDLLESKVKALSHSGPKIQTTGSDIHKSFGGLSAFYKAPEAEQLFAVTKPVADKARDVAADVRVIAGALGTYAREITPLVKQLEQLKRDAADFRHKVDGDDDWREDGDLIEENLGRRNKIAEVWTAFQAAERDCHAKIVGLVGGKRLHAIDSSHKTGYGYNAEDLKQSKHLPWGDAVEESVPWWQVWEHAYDFGKGVIVDGAWGTIKGLGTLLCFDGWEAAGQAWTGLAKLGTGISITTMPLVGPAFLAIPGDKLPSWLRDSRTAMKETGKALVAWDQWESNGSRAAGAVTFNVLTAVFTEGAGAAASGAGKAGAAAKIVSFAGKTGKAIDPMTYVFKGTGTGVTKISAVMAHLKDAGHIQIPKISEGAFSLPEGTVALSPHTVKSPFDGPARYLDNDGNLYKEDGTLYERAEDAPAGKPGQSTIGADHSQIGAPVRQNQLAVAGVGRHGDDISRIGSDASDPAHTGSHAGHGRTGLGDNAPTGRAGDHAVPSGGNTGDHIPANNMNNNPTGGGGRTTDTTPSREGHGTGDARGIPHQGGHGNGSYSHDEAASSDVGSTNGGGSGDGVHGAAHPSTPDEQPPVHLQGDGVAQQPLGKMTPDQEEAVTTALAESKVPPVDQERMLTQLRKSGYGASVAEYIASGRFSSFPGYKDLIFQVKQKDMMPAVHQALEHAAELQAKNAGNIEFELKLPQQKLDLDVLVRSENGIEYGAQLKDLQSANGIKSAVTKIAKMQLAGPGVKVKVAILDICDSKGTLTERALNAVQRAADRTNASFELRFRDGSVTVFPTNATTP